MKPRRVGTMFADLERDQRGKCASPPMTPMKTWSPTAQMARRAQFAKPCGYSEFRQIGFIGNTYFDAVLERRERYPGAPVVD